MLDRHIKIMNHSFSWNFHWALLYADWVAWFGVDFQDHLDKSASFWVKEIGVHQGGIELNGEMYKLKSKYVILKPRKVRNEELIIYTDFNKTF